MADEFNCRPSEVLLERQRLPVGLLDQVIEARRYSEWRRVYTDDPKRALSSAWGQLVMQIEAELIEADQHG